MKNFRWDKKYLYWGVTAFLVIAADIFFFRLLTKLSAVTAWAMTVLKVLAPILTGFVVAYILDGVCQFFEGKLFSRLAASLIPGGGKKAARLARILSIITTQVLTLGIIAGLLTMILPQLYSSIVQLVERSGDYFTAVTGWIDRLLSGDELLEQTALAWAGKIADYIVNYITVELLPRISSVVSSVTSGVYSIVRGLIDLVVGMFISIYVMYNKETFRAQGRKMTYALLSPAAANKTLDELAFINQAFGNFLSGNIIDSLIIGTMNYIFLLCTGVPYTALVSIVMAVLNFIPVFGPFLGAIPCTLLILLENPSKALIFVIFTLVSQQIDGNVIKPAVHGRQSGIGGFWVMFAILFFGGLFGFWGMLLGVPVLTVIYNAARRINAAMLRRRSLPTDTEDYKTVYRIDPVTLKPIRTSNAAAYAAARDGGEKEPQEEPEEQKN